MSAPTYRRRLYELALGQYGYVTAEDARRLDIPPGELSKLAHRGGLVQRARGLYRFADVPHGEHDQFAEAVLWGGPGAVLGFDAVLFLHELADVNPTTIRVIVPHRVRRAPRPEFTLIRADVPPEDRTQVFGIPATTVARALIDCRDMVSATRLHEAIEEALQRGLLLRSERARVLDALGTAA